VDRNQLAIFVVVVDGGGRETGGIASNVRVVSGRPKCRCVCELGTVRCDVVLSGGLGLRFGGCSLFEAGGGRKPPRRRWRRCRGRDARVGGRGQVQLRGLGPLRGGFALQLELGAGEPLQQLEGLEEARRRSGHLLGRRQKARRR
jgi:hypothetical protein